MDSGLVVPVFNQGDDPLAYLNKAMAFLTYVPSLRFPSTNNQLRTSSNPRNQATIQDGRVTVQQVQGRQGQGYASTGYKGECHMARQCTQPKRPRNAAWFKEKAMLAEAQEAGQILNEEQLVFLANLGISDGQATQTTISNTVAFQTEDLDAYDYDCDDVSNAKTVLMANLSNYGSDVILEVSHSETYHNDMDNQNFGKRFVPQQELSDEQAFWLQTSHHNTDQSATSPIQIEAPKELPKAPVYASEQDSGLAKVKSGGGLRKPNDDALRKCILEGPYTPFTVIIPAVSATDNSPAVPERTIVETVLNMSPENKAHFESEKEAIHLILTRIGDEI
ncbi:hypothetical protein Tco_0868077 [Tanacetum coccineum]